MISKNIQPLHPAIGRGYMAQSNWYVSIASCVHNCWQSILTSTTHIIICLEGTQLNMTEFKACTGCPRKKSLIKFFLDNFPTDMDYGPTFSWTVKHPWRPCHSLKRVAGRPLASDRVSGDKVCGWSVVHIRWEVVDEKFYQRLFSGTPCISN